MVGGVGAWRKAWGRGERRGSIEVGVGGGVGEGVRLNSCKASLAINTANLSNIIRFPEGLPVNLLTPGNRLTH